MSNNMTDREFLEMMRTQYNVDDFESASMMCLYLSRFARIANEISEQDDNKYGENNEVALLKASSALDKCSDIFIKTYLDERAL